MSADLVRRMELARDLRRRAIAEVEQLIGETEARLSVLTAGTARRCADGVPYPAASRLLHEATARLDRLYQQRGRLLARQAEDDEVLRH
jgi:hypothetical protein